MAKHTRRCPGQRLSVPRGLAKSTPAQDSREGALRLLEPLACRAGAHAARASARRSSTCGAVDRSSDRREDLELPTKTRGAHGRCHLGSHCGQPQRATEQPGTAPGADEHGQARDVDVAYLRQVQDEPAAGWANEATELLTQVLRARDIEDAAENGNNATALAPGGESRIMDSLDDRVDHISPISPALWPTALGAAWLLA